MGALVILVMIVGLTWLFSSTDATAHDSHRPPMPPNGMLDNDAEHIEVYQTPDGHWHYVKRKIQSEFSLGWFLLGVVLALILIALM